jgi:hypothetical protein
LSVSQAELVKLTTSVDIGLKYVSSSGELAVVAFLIEGRLGNTAIRDIFVGSTDKKAADIGDSMKHPITFIMAA